MVANAPDFFAMLDAALASAASGSSDGSTAFDTPKKKEDDSEEDALDAAEVTMVKKGKKRHRIRRTDQVYEVEVPTSPSDQTTRSIILKDDTNSRSKKKSFLLSVKDLEWALAWMLSEHAQEEPAVEEEPGVVWFQGNACWRLVGTLPDGNSTTLERFVKRSKQVHGQTVPLQQQEFLAAKEASKTKLMQAAKHEKGCTDDFLNDVP